MRATVGLTIRLRDASVARAVAGALAPDNVDFPRGLGLEMERRGQRLRLVFVSTSSVESLLATVDEVLAHVQTAAEALRAAE